MLLCLSCSGQLEYEVAAYQQGNGAMASDAAVMRMVPPMKWDTGAPMAPAMKWDSGAPMAEPMKWDSGAPAPAPMTADAGAPMAPPAPAAGPCPEGTDALKLLATRCGDCHGATDKAKGLDLASPGVAARVVGVKSTCQGKLLLDPAASGASGFLLDKLNGPVAGCGQQMPYGMPALTAPERACLIDWADKAVARLRSGG